MAITLPELSYPIDALEPVISARTLEFHHGKHHNAYVVNTNKLIKGTDLEGDDLKSIIIKTAGDPTKAGIFNNAAQVWNHSFYWKCMRPGGGGAPSGEVAKRIEADFGGYDNFVKAFIEAGTTQFGSGWAWLVVHNDKLEIVKSANAGNPIVDGLTPLLVVDVWEHAYYLDYQNLRPDYLSAFIGKLIDWDFVNANLTS
ncbi:MAG: superoxide dismutase [Proteobacteria bacterium]|nr:superoxide dismutase [Pseudomonadota bacterium]